MSKSRRDFYLLRYELYKSRRDFYISCRGFSFLGVKVTSFADVANSIMLNFFSGFTP